MKDKKLFMKLKKVVDKAKPNNNLSDKEIIDMIIIDLKYLYKLEKGLTKFKKKFL